MKKYLFLLLIIIVGTLSPVSALFAAEDIEMVNRPVNSLGLTGLLFTTMPYTLSPGVVEIGAAVLSENSVMPDYTLTEYPLTVTAGFSPHSEIALRCSYFYLKEGPTVSTPTERTAGNIQLTYKWNFLDQEEGSPKPAISLILTGIVPIETNSDMRINDASHWGMRAGISAGSEISWKEHILGIYGDIQLEGTDLTEKRLRDIYEIVNAGLLFPISKYRNLQMFLEYNIVHGQDIITFEGGDYSAMTYGLRVVNERVNITLGTQILRKNVAGYDNSDRVIGLLSIKF